MDPASLEALVNMSNPRAAPAEGPHHENSKLVQAAIAAMAFAKMIEEWAKEYDPDLDGNPPAWVADESTWERAKEAVDPEGEGSGYDQPYAVVAHVYEKMGGAQK